MSVDTLLLANPVPQKNCNKPICAIAVREVLEIEVRREYSSEILICYTVLTAISFRLESDIVKENTSIIKNSMFGMDFALSFALRIIGIVPLILPDGQISIDSTSHLAVSTETR